ncbi:uncharacterized protein LOC131058874 [Cryptomeria japonica]|uniref:uncharacterized protein LOC131058874 n=1 Tax=Cryptomeria japonica TaxID=3369 RepID=UPI0025ABE53F|nr:uncharacterized protein LOC131058874 [Cryptomeria japonica]
MEFPDVYEWICLACGWKGRGIESNELTFFYDGKYSVSLCAKPYEEKMSLTFNFLEGNNFLGKYEIGRYDIGNCMEESMQNNLLPVLLWMFIDPFILRSSKVICTEAFSRFLDMFRELKLEPRIIEPKKYRLVFNSLICAGCTFFPNPMDDELVLEILAQTQQNTLILMGLEGTHRFMGFLASTLFLFSFSSSKFHRSWTQSIFKRESSNQRLWMQWIFERVSRISYNSSTEGSWIITSYSPLSALKTEEKYSGFREKAHLKWADVDRDRLRWGLNNHQLQCTLQFEPVVNVCSDCIKVSLHLDNVRCDVLSLEGISDESIRGLPKERHFPAKICLTIGPENGFSVQGVSLSVSSSNPITDIGKGYNYEAAVQTDMVGLKASKSTTSTERIKKWNFQHSVFNNTNAKLDWTLYDSTTGKPVFKTQPPKISIFSGKSVSSFDKAFTEEGGVVFARDDYGKPVTWKIYRNFEGQTLKWIVRASIWLTYWPNAYGIHYCETKRHDFRQVVDLTLSHSSSSSSN